VQQYQPPVQQYQAQPPVNPQHQPIQVPLQQYAQPNLQQVAVRKAPVGLIIGIISAVVVAVTAILLIFVFEVFDSGGSTGSSSDRDRDRDRSSSVSPLVGEWECECCGYNFLILNADGTYETRHDSGTYTVSGNKINVIVTDPAQYSDEFELTFVIDGNKLTINFIELDEEGEIVDTHSETFIKRVPAATTADQGGTEQPPTANLAGTWECNCCYSTIVMTSGGRYTHSDGETGSYTISGNTLTTISDQYGSQTGTFTLSGNHLTLDAGGDIMEMWRISHSEQPPAPPQTTPPSTPSADTRCYWCIRDGDYDCKCRCGGGCDDCLDPDEICPAVGGSSGGSTGGSAPTGNNRCTVCIDEDYEACKCRCGGWCHDCYEDYCA
jgi:hypothetical protein